MWNYRRALLPMGVLRFPVLHLYSQSANISHNEGSQEKNIVGNDANQSSQMQGWNNSRDDEGHSSDPKFDHIEAAAQELHDLCYGMISFLRKADPEANKHLFMKRSQRRLREPVPEYCRRLLHGHFDRSMNISNNFRSRSDFEKATKLYCEMAEKILMLLNKPLVDRLLLNAGKAGRDQRVEGIHRHRRHIDRASWRTFPFRWYRHSPFELQNLRADISPVAVQNARFFRDMSTIRSLFSIIEPVHPYRDKIEKKLFVVTEGYTPGV